jgi:hypothetical protein
MDDVDQAVTASIRALKDEARQTPLLAPLCALREFAKRNVDAIRPKVDSILDRLNASVLSVVVEPTVSCAPRIQLLSELKSATTTTTKNRLQTKGGGNGKSWMNGRKQKF